MLSIIERNSRLIVECQPFCCLVPIFDRSPQTLRNERVLVVCVTGIAGVINMVGVVISKGFLDYSKPSFLSNCFLHGFMTWTGSGLYYGAAVVRVSAWCALLILKYASNSFRLPKVHFTDAGKRKFGF